MKQHLVDTIFEIQEKIMEVIPPDDQDFWDSGMFIDPVKSGSITVIWRDYAFGNGDEEYNFSYSTCGELKGDLPSQYKKQIEDILAPYCKKVPFSYVSNIDGVDA